MTLQTQPRRRNLERTRRTLLDATRSAVVTHGLAVSLDVIAADAGVSKGGLLHHFASKDDLLLALAQDLYSRFESDVQRRLQRSAPGPGRAARAYVRAHFHELRAAGRHLDHGTLLHLVATVGPVAQFVAERRAHWRTLLSADGLSPDLVRLVMCCLDGAAMSVLTGQLTRSGAALRATERHLLALIDGHQHVEALFART